MSGKKIGVSVIIIIVVLALGVGVGYYLSTNTNNCDFENKEYAEDNKSSSGDTGRKLNVNELDLFEKYLETPGIKDFIKMPYSDLTEFSLNIFLMHSYLGRTATKEEIKEITGEDNPPVPLHLFFKTNIEYYFKEHTGKDLSIIKKENLPDYSEKYYSYYNRVSDADLVDIDVISGVEYGNKYIIRFTNNNYNYGNKATFELTLNKVNGQYLFVSNVIVK